VLRRIPLSALLCLASASWLGPAQATPEYPLVLDATSMTNCGEPAARCLVCHTTARGGQGTAEQPFALELRKLGLNRGRDPNLLRSVLARLADATDSDKDGLPDKQELGECGNPSGDDLRGGPVYGCDGAQLAPHVASRSGHNPALAALALGLAALLVHFARRR
jgi:hypothetical protein